MPTLPEGFSFADEPPAPEGKKAGERYGSTPQQLPEGFSFADEAGIEEGMREAVGTAKEGWKASDRALGSAVGRALEEGGRQARGLLTGEVPATPENVLPAAAAALSPSTQAGRLIARARGPLAERQAASSGIHPPRAADWPVTANVLSRVPVMGAPLQEAAKRSAAEVAAAIRRAPSQAGAVGQLDDAMVQAMVGMHPRQLAAVRASISSQEWPKVQSAVLGRLGATPQEWLAAYRGMHPATKNVLFDKAGLRFHLDAIEAMAKRTEQWKPGPVLGRRIARGFGFGYGAMEPLTVLSVLLPGRVFARYLANPSTAASIAQWGRSYERFVESGGSAAALASLKIASNNLRNTTGEKFSDEQLVEAINGKPMEQVGDDRAVRR